MRLHDTKSGATVEFEPRVPGRVDIYVCGLTVSGPPHVGHGRTYISFDIMRRWLRQSGWQVRYIQNVTDIEDKIIARAHAESVPAETVAARYEVVQSEMMRKLRILPPDDNPHATDHVDEMIEMIGRLVDAGAAYEAGGDVYYSVESFDAYGALSHQSPDDLLVGARVEPGEHKHSPLDFALWKGAKPGEPTWPSPWGEGRPGWHIECSVMSVGALGMGFDIHGGGADLIFPHHENEIAQAEAALGEHPFARYWLHTGMVNLAGEKMSKSVGNVVSLEDIMNMNSTEAIRLLVAQSHYRKQLEFTPDLVEECEGAVVRLGAFRDRCASALGPDGAAGVAPEQTAIDALALAMDDDFHTPGACAALFDLVKRGNVALDAGDTSGAAAALAALEVFDDVLCVVPPKGGSGDDGLLDDLVTLLLDLRARAHGSRDFDTADLIRGRLGEIGVVVEDTADGARWRRGRRAAAQA